jgi:excisionase family DNA binding protein
MQEFISPKQVARAIGVSESTLKRWCNQGLLSSIRTAGGHRKLPIAGVLEFLKQSGHTLVEPELLGLPATVGQGAGTLHRAKDRLKNALIRGDEAVARQVVFDLYLSKNQISEICDKVIADTFNEIGDLWDCGEVEVYEERLSCGICLRILHELRTVIPPVPPKAPVAIGGTLDGDLYQLQTTMAELVLRDNGWNATSLGNSLPFSTLKAAIQKRQPQLFWLSISFVRDQDIFLEEIEKIYETATENHAALVVGGRALTDELRKKMKYSSFCDTMQHLETFAATIHHMA